MCLPRLLLWERVLVVIFTSDNNQLISVDFPTPDCPNKIDVSFLKISIRPSLFISSLAETTQSLNFYGNLEITKNWKIGFRSGYDFDENELTYSSIDIYRDLHCWELLLNWIPIGYHKSYTLTIRVKAAALRDLKYEKKKDWFTPEYN